MAKISFYYDTSKFRRSHMREPRGYGGWAFSCPTARPHMPEVVFAPASTYADAKRWIAAEVRKLAPADYAGTIYIDVLP